MNADIYSKMELLVKKWINNPDDMDFRTYSALFKIFKKAAYLSHKTEIKDYFHSFLHYVLIRENVIRNMKKVSEKGKIIPYINRMVKNFMIAEHRVKKRQLEMLQQERIEIKLKEDIQQSATLKCEHKENLSSFLIIEFIRSLDSRNKRVMLNFLREKTDRNDIYLEMESAENRYKLRERFKKKLLLFLHEKNISKNDLRTFFMEKDFMSELRSEID